MFGLAFGTAAGSGLVGVGVVGWSAIVVEVMVDGGGSG